MTGFDPRPPLAKALDQMGDLIATTDPSDADRPTPCADYTVGQLIDHVQAVVRRIGAVLAGEPFWSVPQSIPSRDWPADWAEGRRLTDAILADDSSMTREVELPWGKADGASAAASYIGELTVHAWDLAVATGRAEDLDPTLAVATLPGYQAMVPAERRGEGIPFDQVVETGPDAGPYERLVAWTGRDPGFAA
ncbi:TIGR03086 family protein [Tessaracoccus aquimaris]|uniref:TIGR03086 family protein n=1 Tax=Tessaracoccus aquimaris TaxID=1332264 RepID=A0A1Q2CSA0_9ACTN|nr:TIGR03086 family metal-binding protein [Tessaracoccus aquimaris]AQP49003.1 TIGR03086 family protein [Tessaracoccus aquimaris]